MLKNDIMTGKCELKGRVNSRLLNYELILAQRFTKYLFMEKKLTKSVVSTNDQVCHE